MDIEKGCKMKGDGENSAHVEKRGSRDRDKEMEIKVEAKRCIQRQKE